MVAAFNEVYPNIEVTITQYSNTGDGNIGVDTALMAGGQIDVIQNFGFTNQSESRCGLLIPLDDLLAKDGFDLVRVGF